MLARHPSTTLDRMDELIRKRSIGDADFEGYLYDPWKRD